MEKIDIVIRIAEVLGDAMLALMIKSSNTLAHTIARVVGEKILNAK